MTEPNRDMDELLRANPHMQRAWKRFRHPTGVHPWRWRFLWVWILVFSVLVGWAFHVQGNLIHQGQQAHDSLCALQQNLQLQIAASQQYLADVQLYQRDVAAGRVPPRGRKPIEGISNNDIEAGIMRSQLTLASLHDLHCEAGRAVPDRISTLPGVTVPPSFTTTATTTTTGGK